MQRSKLIYLFFLVILSALFLPLSALADAAPPDVPDGENINPGEETTMVQMVAEEVIIDVGLTREVLQINDYGDLLGGYIVAYNCTFWLENKGTETESLAVRFPITTDQGYGKINIHSIKVNDQPAPWIEDEVEHVNHGEYKWAHFDVVFPPGEEVEVKVTYTTVTRAWPGAASHSLSYILETGAGWYGPIEQGRIILRLPYQATSENVLIKDFRAAEGKFNRSDLFWDFTDLEPTAEDNLFLRIIAPDLWLEILAERTRLEESPNNFSALYRLAEYIADANIIKGAAFYSTTLYEEGLEAIKRAISLNPNDIQSHELYLYYLGADYSMESSQLILEEVGIILELDPENSTARSYKEIAWAHLKSFQTATARAISATASTSTPNPTATPIPTATLKSNTLTPTNEPTQDYSPTITPKQLVVLDVEEESFTNNTNNILLSIGFILFVISLLFLGGMAVMKIVNKK